MSYDVQIWSLDPIPLPAALPDVQTWELGGEAWVRKKENWQIVVSPSVEVLPEDLPDGVVGLLPGIAYLAELNLEPLGAPQSAHELLAGVSKRLASAAHGLVLDPQTGAVITPRGVRRYRPHPRDKRFSALTLSWWFTQGPLLADAGLREFVSLLERMLPEALPRRYGLFEPPQHLYSETGREHFLGFLQEHLGDTFVWYPHRPVVGVSVFCSPSWGAMPQGFRANFVCVRIEAAVLEQPGWHTALDRFWRAASRVIRPFYGDVTTLKGYLRMGGTYGSDMHTDFHPVKGPWWIGIPRRLGHAAVLGEPYLSLWPGFVEAAQVSGDLAFLSTADWSDQEEASRLLDAIPDALAQRWIPEWTDAPGGGKTVNWNTHYPPQWPFEKPGRGSG